MRRRARDQWPVLIQAHHPAYVGWEEYMQTQEQLRQNWQRDGSKGVARQRSALLQGIVWCGHWGRKMGVQHHATRGNRSPTSICQMGHQQDGEDRICQSMTARPVDRAVVQAFLEAASPVGVEVAVQVLAQVEQHQWELQLEQARYEARLAQRKYDAVDPDNRLVAAELERRWNAQLTRLAELEQAYAKAEQEARFTLTAEERAAMQTLAMESEQLDGVSQPGWIEIQIRWRGARGDAAGREAHPARRRILENSRAGGGADS